MWIFSVEGFVSVVEHRDCADRVMVCGRSKTDVEAFAKKLGRKVMATPRADYPFRFTTRKRRMARLLRELVCGIDYPDFKTAVADRQGAARDCIYQEIWTLARAIR